MMSTLRMERLCRLTLLLALVFFLRITGLVDIIGVGAARLWNRFTNLSNGVEPPRYPQAATKQITAKNREPC